MICCVIWDFNGTLIDDVQTAVCSVNDTLRKCGLPLTDTEQYRRNMDMPITRYYEKHFDLRRVTFDFLSKEYHQGYERYKGLIKPAPGALDTVRELKARGVRQCVVSSFEQGRLLSLLSEYGFLPYLDGVCGAEDDICESKVYRGSRWISRQGIDPQTAVVVGDLVHDSELAQAIGCECLLYSWGHQDRERLYKSGCRVIDDLREVLEYEKEHQR